MPPNVRACLYVLVAVVLANILAKRVFPEKKQAVTTATIGWALLTVAVFLSPSVEIYFIIVGIVLVFLAPKLVEDRLQFYFAMLPVIPVYVQWRLTLPGVDTLLIFDHIKLLALLLLVPIYLRRPRRTGPDLKPSLAASRSRRVFIIFFAFLVFSLMLDLRESNFTSIVRGVLDRYLDQLILVIVIFVICQSRETVDKVFFGTLLSGIFLGFLSCIEAGTHWQVYHTIDASFSIGGISLKRQGAAFRGGFLRTPVSMAPIPFGIFMSICLVLNFYFLRLKKLGNTEYGGSILMTCIFLAGLLFSGSRGAWMLTILMIGLMVIMQEQFKPLRWLAVVGAIGGLLLVPPVVQYLVAHDPYGTFQYRIDLLSNSLIAVKDSFYLGSLDFKEHPAMLDSLQGQGIVDVVNAYIGIGLGSGVPLLIVFVYVILRVVFLLARLRKKAEGQDELKLLEWQARIALVLIIGEFAMILSMSLVDRVAHYLWVSLMLGLCVYRYGDRELNSKSHLEALKVR